MKENENILEPVNGGDSSPLLPIESLIHVIRGQQVMLDSDLGRLYGVETRVLNQAVKRRDGVSATIYTDPRHSQITNDLRRHNAQYPRIEVKHCTNVHDRFLIIDDTVYFIGGSIKDLGKRIVAFSQMHQNPDDILSRLR